MSQQTYLQTVAAWQKELLEATGNVWAVDCYDGGNRRVVVRTVYCRTATRERAEAIGRSVSRKRCVSARPWDPIGNGLERFIARQRETAQ